MNSGIAVLLVSAGLPEKPDPNGDGQKIREAAGAGVNQAAPGDEATHRRGAGERRLRISLGKSRLFGLHRCRNASMKDGTTRNGDERKNFCIETFPREFE